MSIIDSLGYVPPSAGCQMVPLKLDTGFCQEDISLHPTHTILRFAGFGKKITADFMQIEGGCALKERAKTSTNATWNALSVL